MDWVESDPRKTGGGRVRVMSKTDYSSISLVGLGSNISSRLSANSSRTIFCFASNASGSLMLARWPLKPPKPLATQTHEPKADIELSSGTMHLKLDDAIKFTRGSLMNTPTAVLAVSVYPSSPLRDTPEVVSL